MRQARRVRFSPSVGWAAMALVATAARGQVMGQVPADATLVLRVDRLDGPLTPLLLKAMGVPRPPGGSVVLMAAALGVPGDALDGDRDAAVVVAGVEGRTSSAVLLVPVANFSNFRDALPPRWSAARRGRYAAVAVGADLLKDTPTTGVVAPAYADPPAGYVWANLAGDRGVLRVLAAGAPPATRPTTAPTTATVTRPVDDAPFHTADAFLRQIGRPVPESDLRNDLAVLAIANHDWPTAAAQVRVAIHLVPRAAVPHVNLATVLYNQSRPLDAATELQEAYRLDPTDYDACHNAGFILAQLHSYPRAVRLLTAAVRLRPDSPEAHNDLGVALLLSGKAHAAEAELAAAVRLRPSYAEAKQNLDVARRRAATRP